MLQNQRNNRASCYPNHPSHTRALFRSGEDAECIDHEDRRYIHAGIGGHGRGSSTEQSADPRASSEVAGRQRRPSENMIGRYGTWHEIGARRGRSRDRARVRVTRPFSRASLDGDDSLA